MRELSSTSIQDFHEHLKAEGWHRTANPVGIYRVDPFTRFEVFPSRFLLVDLYMEYIGDNYTDYDNFVEITGINLTDLQIVTPALRSLPLFKQNGYGDR